MTSLRITNPATGKTIKTLASDDPLSVCTKYEAARVAQPTWAVVPIRKKVAVLAKFRSLLNAQTEELAGILTKEVGKPIKQSRNELTGVLGRIDFFLAEAARALRAETVLTQRNPDGTRLVEKISHEPLGVIASISAWNYPYFVGCNVFVPALLAGNAVLYKPSEFATLTGLAIARLLHASGVPKDIFLPLVGTGEVGAALVKQPIDGVFFTGSNATGKKIARAVTGRSIKLQLELGGKDPVYVCEDADVKIAAASIADGAFYNTGQSCCSVERIYLREEIYADFVEAFTAEVKRYKLGNPRDEGTYLGPLTRPQQLDVLEAQIADARKKGGRIVMGGARILRPGNYFQPTVILNVNHRMAVMRQESFGPIIGIMAVRSDEQAVALMNDTSYGLTAAVYSASETRAKAILSQVRSGSAYWNCCDRVSPRLPWSGLGDSGIGLTLSKYGIQTFARPRAWHLRSALGTPAINT